MSDTTHLSTIEAEVRRLANSCDLGGFNKEFFLSATFVSDIAQLVQAREREAYKRGQASVQHPATPQKLL